MTVNNPAGRLLAVMERAGSVSLKNSGANAWQQVLRDDDEEPLELHSLLERLARVVVLPAGIRHEVGSIDNVKHDLYLRHVGVWEQAFSSRIRFDAQLSHFMELFKPEHVYCLETCDELLSRERPEPVLSSDFVGQVVQDLDELRGRVVQSDLDHDVRKFLLTGLDRMREALRHYRFSGVPPVIDALEASLGAAHLQPDVLKRSKETDLGNEYWAGLGRIYSHVRQEWQPYRALKGVVVDFLALPSGP